MQQNRSALVIITAVAAVLPVLACATLDAAAPPAKKPPWQRYLQGNDARKAADLDEKLGRFQAAGKFEEALKVAQSLADLRKKVQREDHWEAIDALHDVTAIRHVLKQDTVGRTEYASLASLQGQADMLFASGRYRDAQLLLDKVLAIRRKVLGEQNPATALSYNNLAASQNMQGKYALAEESYRKALDIQRKVLGEDHPATATSYSNQALNQNMQGKYAQAEEGYRKALDIFRRILSEDHPDTAVSYNNLAQNQHTQGKYAQAEEGYRKALAIQRKMLGEDHPETARSYNNLAANHDDQGKHVQAEEGHRRALAIWRKVLGEDHPDTAASYNNLALNQNDQGKYAQAEEGYRKALEIKRKVLGENHPQTALSYLTLGGGLQVQGKYVQAEESCRKALDIFRKVLGEDHPLTANSYSNLAATKKSQGKYAQAEEGYHKALAIYRKAFGEEHPKTAGVHNNLAVIQEAQGKYALAEEDYRKALDIRRKVLGEEHPLTVLSYNNLAYNQNCQGKYILAEDYWQKAADRFDRARSRIAPTGLDRATKTSERSHLSLLAAVLARNGKPAAAWERFEQSLGRGTWDDLSTRLRRPQAERTRQDQLVARLNRLDLLIERTFSAKQPSGEQLQRRKELLTQQRQTQDDLNAFTAGMEQRYGPVAGQVFDRAPIQRALPPDAALIAWIDIRGLPTAKDTNGEHLAVLLRSAGDPVFVPLPRTGAKDSWSAADTRLPAELRAALQSERGAWQPLAQRLRTQRLAPLAKHLAAANGLPAVRHLIVLPSAALAGVPVEVFAEGYTVSYALSGTMYAHLRRQAPPTAKGLLALGDPVFNPPAGASAAPPLPPGGVLLTAVTPGSNAARSGLRPNDVLLMYAGKELTTPADLQVATADPGTERISVRVWRDGKTFTRQVQPGKLGVVFADLPAPKAVAELRRLDRRLAARGGEDDNWPQLPGTRAEVEALRQLFGALGDKPGGSLTLLFDSDASEQRLNDLAIKRELGQYRYLHLATHGEVDNRMPLRSAVILSRDHLPDPGKQLDTGLPIFDGRLTAEKILQDWHLDSELVTLSACQTALGKFEGGEGFVGFAQALILSGSRGVCLSLWKVDDTATALLMERFYQNLLGQRAGLKAPMPKGLALAKAKAWLRQLPREQALARMAQLSKGVARGKGRTVQPLLPGPPAAEKKDDDRPYAHPYYWAAFVLIGDER